MQGGSEPSSSSARPYDPITNLQLAVDDLCGVYRIALGDLQNAVEAKHQGIDQMVADFAGRVVSAHQDLNDQALALQRAHRSEAAQMSRLRELEREHEAVTEELRSQTEATEVVRATLVRDLDSLIDGILAANPRRHMSRDHRRRQRPTDKQ